MREWLLTEGSFMKAYYDKGADTRDSSWLSGDVWCIARIAEEHFIEQSNGEWLLYSKVALIYNIRDWEWGLLRLFAWLLSRGILPSHWKQFSSGRLTPVLHRVPLMIVNSAGILVIRIKAHHSDVRWRHPPRLIPPWFDEICASKKDFQSVSSSWCLMTQDDMGQRGAHLRAVMLLKSEVDDQIDEIVGGQWRRYSTVLRCATYCVSQWFVFETISYAAIVHFFLFRKVLAMNVLVDRFTHRLTSKNSDKNNWCNNIYHHMICHDTFAHCDIAIPSKGTWNYIITYPTKREKENHRLRNGLVLGYVTCQEGTLPKTNIAPENRPKPKRKVVSQHLPTTNFQGICYFPGV